MFMFNQNDTLCYLYPGICNLLRTQIMNMSVNCVQDIGCDSDITKYFDE
jgi:hypothetical protein